MHKVHLLWTRMLVAALFIIGKKQKQPKWSFTVFWKIYNILFQQNAKRLMKWSTSTVNKDETHKYNIDWGKTNLWSQSPWEEEQGRWGPKGTSAVLPPMFCFLIWELVPHLNQSVKHLLSCTGRSVPFPVYMLYFTKVYKDRKINKNDIC